MDQTTTITDLFAAAAISYALPVGEEGNSIGQSVTHARRACGTRHTSIVDMLVHTATQIRATDPELAHVEVEHVMLAFVGEALRLLGAAVAPSNKTVILTTEGDHSAHSILDWLNDSGHGQYRDHLGPAHEQELAEHERVAAPQLHVTCDYTAGAALFHLREV